MVSVAAVEALVADWEPKTRAAFISAVKDIRDGVVLARLEAAIEAGDDEAALAEVGLGSERFQSLDTVLSAAAAVAGAAAMATVNKARASGAAVVFDLREYAVEAWLRENNRALMGAISDDQRAMVRREIATGRSDGKGARSIVTDLLGRRSTVTGRREGALVGLSSAQVAWVRNYEAELTGVPSKAALTRTLRDPRFDRAVESAIRENRPLPATTRQSMVSAYRNRALRQRADSLAEMEASTVIHQAQRQAVEQAVRRGVITADQVRRFPVTMEDNRVRPTHRLIPGLNKGGVGLNEMFITPDGPKLNAPFGRGCRCKVRIGIFAQALRLAA